jgi:hypothetical protein
MKVGKVLDEGEGERDAIHVAITPVEAGQDLARGQRVRIIDGLAYHVFGERGVGVVDPFLPEGVKRGQRFMLFVYPDTITSLHHEWEHPDLPSRRTQAFAAALLDRPKEDPDGNEDNLCSGCSG